MEDVGSYWHGQKPLGGDVRLTTSLLYYCLTCHESWLGATIILFIFLGGKVNLNQLFLLLEKMLSRCGSRKTNKLQETSFVEQDGVVLVQMYVEGLKI
jgi:hypothetical protein